MIAIMVVTVITGLTVITDGIGSVIVGTHMEAFPIISMETVGVILIIPTTVDLVIVGIIMEDSVVLVEVLIQIIIVLQHGGQEMVTM
jgi:hypothetical protein